MIQQIDIKHKKKIYNKKLIAFLKKLHAVAL
jgi:hypothetical protein